MKLIAKTSMTIAQPSEKVYDAITKAEKIINFWATESSGSLEVGKTVEWTMGDFDNAVVKVTTHILEIGKKISFDWDATGGITKVAFTMKEINGETFVEVTEDGWEKSDSGIEQYAINTGGWVSFLCFLKAYLEHGINLRKGAYKQ